MLFKIFPLIMLAFILMVPVAEVRAQEDESINPDTLWDYTGVTRISFSDVGLHQWTGGGQNTTALNGMLNIRAQRDGEVTMWDSRLRSGYGITRTGSRDAPFQKTDDYVMIMSQLNRDLREHLDWTAMMDFRTQMRRGWTYDDEGQREEVVSKAMAPAYLVSSLGIQYEPYSSLTLNLSPLSGKTTFILREDILPIADLYGLEPNQRIKHEFGASLNSHFDFRIMENIRFENELLLFTPYNDMFRKIDINWEAMLSLRVNDYITATITTHLIYDEDIMVRREDGTRGPGTQFKRMLSAGFAYELF